MLKINERAEGIPFGKDDRKNNKRLRSLIAEHENQYAYSGCFADEKVYVETRDNKRAFNGKGRNSWKGSVRVPSMKRNDKVWKRFYILFPEYRRILEDALAGRIPCVKGSNYVGVEAGYSNVSTRMLVETNFTKLKIIKF